MSRKLRLLLAGATGAVGQAVLQRALADTRIGRIIAPSRRPLVLKDKRLDNPLVDFTALPDAEWWACDAVVCALGTTIRQAGSPAAFAAVDRDLPIEIGRRARAEGAKRYALNSSLGASLRGNFYLRTKAEAERGIIDLGFESVTVVRPSLIDTTRAQLRPAEFVGILAARTLRPLIPARYRAVTPERIALALLQGAVAGAPGVHFIESDRL
jgi:uncharacterized protein YbjT (DUF2867 family)